MIIHVSSYTRVVMGQTQLARSLGELRTHDGRTFECFEWRTVPHRGGLRHIGTVTRLSAAKRLFIPDDPASVHLDL